MKKILSIVCLIAFMLNLSINATMISVNAEFKNSLKEEIEKEPKDNIKIYDKNIKEVKKDNEIIEVIYDNNNEKYIHTEEVINGEYTNNYENSNDYTFELIRGKYYEVSSDTNNDFWINHINSNTSKYDILSYDENGNPNAGNQGSLDKAGSIYVNSKNKFKIATSSRENVKLAIPNEYKNNIVIKEINTPLYYKKEVFKNKSYEIVNNLNTTAIITHNSLLYHILHFENNGDMTNTPFNSFSARNGYYSSDMGIHRNGKIKITISPESGGIIGIPYEYKNNLIIKELNEPVFKILEITSDKSYEIVNNSNLRLFLNRMPIYPHVGANYIKYNSYGITDTNINDTSNDKYILHDKGDKLKISAFNNEVYKLLVPYEYRNNIKVIDKPAFKKIEINKYKTYEIFSNESVNMIHENSDKDFRFDYLRYDEYGNFENISIDNSYQIYLDSYSKYRIAMNKESNLDKLEFYIPQEYTITVKEISGPLFKTITLDNRNNYEIINRMDNSYNLISDIDESNSDVLYDIISYDKDNNISTMSTNNEYQYNSANIDRKIKISLTKGESIRFYVPYDFSYEINTITTPIIIKKDILPNKTYEISNSTIKIDRDSYLQEYDIIGYSPNGNIEFAQHASDYSQSVFNNRNGTIKLRLTSGDNMKIILPYEDRNNIKETNNLLLRKVSLEKNRDYIIKNTNNFNVIVDTDIIYKGDYYKITYYDFKGNIKETVNENIGAFKINTNESVKVSTHLDGHYMYVPYEIEIDGSSDPDSIIGDFNTDGKVDILDLSLMAIKYNKTKGQSGWDTSYDLNKDNIIDIFDLSLLSQEI